MPIRNEVHDGEWKPVMKPTRFMTNSREIARKLQKQCDGSHEHVPLEGGRAKMAQVYPDELCRKICHGLMMQLEQDGRVRQGQTGIGSPEIDKPARIRKSELNSDMGDLGHAICRKCQWSGIPDLPGFCPDCGCRNTIDWKRPQKKRESDKEKVRYVTTDEHGKRTYWDDTTGTRLPTKLVEEARKEEKRHVDHHQVYDECDVDEAIRITGKGPIATKWIDVNKGDEKNFEVRSRWVAKQLKIHCTEKSPFAATPPLETQKLFFSLAVTDGYGRNVTKTEQGMKMDSIDIRRAFFHAPAQKAIYVQLPEEWSKPGKCGRLKKSLYGTTDAAANWEKAYSEFMVNIGFTRGKACPCLFYHSEKRIWATVHGDDFTILAMEKELEWFRKRIAERFEVKFRGRIGPATTDEKSIRILNRILTWTEDGIEYEADQRHAEIVAKACEGNKRNISTPGEKEEESDIMDENMMTPNEASEYRARCARANYLSQDRSDVQFATKEMSKRMANPSVSDGKKAKRLARYLHENPRVSVQYAYQKNMKI